MSFMAFRGKRLANGKQHHNPSQVEPAVWLSGARLTPGLQLSPGSYLIFIFFLSWPLGMDKHNLLMRTTIFTMSNDKDMDLLMRTTTSRLPRRPVGVT